MMRHVNTLALVVVVVSWMTGPAWADRVDSGFEVDEYEVGGGFEVGGKNAPNSTKPYTVYGSGGLNLQATGFQSSGGIDILWWENSSALGSGNNDQEIYDPSLSLDAGATQGDTGVALPTPHGGDQAFRISNAKGNQGAILTAGVQVYEVAGESDGVAHTSGGIGTSSFGPSVNQHGENNTTPVPTNATRNHTFAGWWFRSVSDSISEPSNEDFGFSFAQTDLGGQRMTHIALYSDNIDGTLRATASGGVFLPTPTYNDFESVTSSALNWGDWYYVTEEVEFKNTPNSGSPGNTPGDLPEAQRGADVVTYTIREDDGSGNPGNVVFRTTVSTWEAQYFFGSYGGPLFANVGVDTWTVRVQNAIDLAGQEDWGIVLDDVTWMTMRDGDINGDRVVNLADLSLLAANFGNTNAWWTIGDLNGDINVNLGDLSLLAANWGAGVSGAATSGIGAAVPEPTSLLVLTALSPLMMLRRKRA